MDIWDAVVVPATMLLTSLAAKARLNVFESQEVALARDSRELLPRELLLEDEGALKKMLNHSVDPEGQTEMTLNIFFSDDFKCVQLNLS